MLVVTTPTLEGHRITKYLGFVSGDAILGANIFKYALEEMFEDAHALGANAVVGVDMDYETITLGRGGGMLMVSASGTAVVVE